MATQREQKDEKDLTQKLLRYQGKDYQDWIHEKHLEFNRENSDIFKKLLTKAIKEKEKPNVQTSNTQSQREETLVSEQTNHYEYEGANA